MRLAKSSEKQKAYSRLLDTILCGDILQDVPFSERRLAESVVMGRTPVREAIKDLVREGVLEAYPTRGTLVRQFTLRDVQENYQVRYAIEGLAAFLAIEARNGELAQKLIFDHLHKELEVRTRLFQSPNHYAPIGIPTQMEVG